MKSFLTINPFDGSRRNFLQKLSSAAPQPGLTPPAARPSERRLPKRGAAPVMCYARVHNEIPLDKQTARRQPRRNSAADHSQRARARASRPSRFTPMPTRARAHVAAADEARLIGPPEAAPAISISTRSSSAARAAGADAIHPGYGFLSERPEFARAVARPGMVFVGPPADVMAALGDKVAARRLAVARRASRWCRGSRRSTWPQREQFAAHVGLSAPGQGGGRWRRPRDARGRRRQPGLPKRAGGGGARGPGGLRRRPRVPREVSRPSAPRRSAGARRPARQSGCARRARLFDSAAPSENHRGVARPRTRRRSARSDGRSGAEARARGRLSQRRHDGVSGRRRRTSTSSKPTRACRSSIR